MAYEKKYIIREVCRALDILEQFTASRGELSAFDLCCRLGLSSKRISRHLKTLESRLFIERNRDSWGYRLGPNAFATAQASQRGMGLLRLARPLLERVVDLSNETTNLAILKGAHTLCQDTVESNHAVRIVPRVGLLLPSYCTASGKIQLAYMESEERERLLANLSLKPHTPTTIINTQTLRIHLAEAACCGYAVDNEELDSGLRCVSAPIRNFTGRTIAAISISGPSMRLTSQRIRRELAPLITRTGEELSLKLGHAPPTVETRGSRDLTGQQQAASTVVAGTRSAGRPPECGEMADLLTWLATETNDYTRPLQAE